MPAEISIPKRRGKAKIKVSTKRAMAEAVLEEVKRQGVDVEVALIQGLIPLGLKAVEPIPISLASFSIRSIRN